MLSGGGAGLLFCPRMWSLQQRREKKARDLWKGCQMGLSPSPTPPFPMAVGRSLLFWAGKGRKHTVNQAERRAASQISVLQEEALYFSVPGREGGRRERRKEEERQLHCPRLQTTMDCPSPLAPSLGGRCLYQVSLGLETPGWAFPCARTSS